MSQIAATAFKGLGTVARGAGKWGGQELGTPLKALDFARKGIGLEMPSNFNKAAWLLPGVGIAAALTKPLVDVAGGRPKGLTLELDKMIQEKRAQISQQMKAERLQTAMAENMTRLAASNPQLYNQLLVGRMLPQGAVVIGGGKKTDFLESVAYQMATGGFGNTQVNPDSSDVMQSLVNSY